MGFVRQSFKRQIFVVFLAVTLFLVIFGGVLTIQGFQARIKSEYEKRDAELLERYRNDERVGMVSAQNPYGFISNPTDSYRFSNQVLALIIALKQRL